MRGTFKQRRYEEALAAVERDCIECKRAIKAGNEEARHPLDLLRAIAKAYRELIAKEKCK